MEKKGFHDCRDPTNNYIDDGLRVIIDFSHPGQAVIAHDRPSFLSSMNPSNNSRKKMVCGGSRPAKPDEI